MKLKVGLIGTRGMVGTVLLQRMLEENDFAEIDATFFSSSEMGQCVPIFPELYYKDAYDLAELGGMDVLLTCRGSEYTQAIYAPLRDAGWQGYFIDAASRLRLAEDSMICLDPVNGPQLRTALKAGIKTFVGGNCTVSLMLMALSQVIATGEVEFLTAVTYQAASGAGMQGMHALLEEMKVLGQRAPSDFILNPAHVYAGLGQRSPLGGPLAGSLLPWIDTDSGEGISREEAKMSREAAKIMGLSDMPPMDSLCVRVGVLRCHSQALTLRFKRAFSEEEFTHLIQTANPWVQIVPNEKAASLQALTPAHISGHLRIAVGRIRKLNLPGHVWSLFTVGDQLLWGAAEPLRRMLRTLTHPDI